MSNRWFIAGGITAGLTVSAAGLCSYLAWRYAHPLPQLPRGTPADNGLPYEDVRFFSQTDSLPLAGWWIPAPRPNGVSVVVTHGYGHNRLNEPLPGLDLLQRLVAAGYGTLLYDMRNCGTSGRAFTTGGYHEMGDVLAAASFVRSRRPEGERVVLLGYSLGAVSSLLAAAADPNIDAVIADSPIADVASWVGEVMQVRARRWGHAGYPLGAGLSVFARWATDMTGRWTGIRLREYAPLTQVAQLRNRPVLFIHGTADSLVPWRHSARLAATCDWPGVELWPVEGAEHVRSYCKDPDAYFARLDAFLQALQPQPCLAPAAAGS